LRTHYGLEIPYKTLWGIVHQRLKSRPKVVRPQSKARDDAKAVEFKKKAFRLSRMATLFHHENAKIRYWCQDETRFGLKTVTRRRITPRGVKPYGQVQWSFQTYYIYDAIEPLTGDSWFLEFSHLNTDCFQAYLNEFSQAYPDDLHIIQTDNATGHTAKRLVIPA